MREAAASPSRPVEAPTPAQPTTITLVDADPGFAGAVPTEHHALARRVLALPMLRAPRGTWEPPLPATWRAPVCGLLVVGGAIGRDVSVGGRVATQFSAPGDILHPWAPMADSLPAGQAFTVHEPATLAVLDARFALAAAKWPALAAVVAERLGEQVLRATVHAAIAQLPRVEQRVLACLWQLAERFGRVAADGVVIELRLTHALIGQCVGARRPTVSLAVRALLDEGLLRRRPDGAWVLDQGSQQAIEGDLPIRTPFGNAA